jgi:hypothetical protein
MYKSCNQTVLMDRDFLLLPGANVFDVFVCAHRLYILDCDRYDGGNLLLDS